MLLHVLRVICTNTNLQNYRMVTPREQQGNDCPALRLILIVPVIYIITGLCIVGGL